MERTKNPKIKIGQNIQANKPIYLLADGSLECGAFRYRGRYQKIFKKYYHEILELTETKPIRGIIDVSKVKFWDAISLYDEYILLKWRASISANQILKFAYETKIKILIENIKPEFRRAVELKWRKIFKRSNADDPSTPKQAWQIF